MSSTVSRFTPNARTPAGEQAMSRPPRILILSVSAGAGHLRAAQAVELALKELAPQAVVRNIDVLDLTNATFRRIYGRTYLDLFNHVPHLLGYLYDVLDRSNRRNRTGDWLRGALERLNLGKFIQLLKEEHWDLAVCTHFLPAAIIASLRKKGRIDLPQVTVTIDFETHRLWVNQPCEHYFTATDEGARYVHSWGVPKGDTTVTGMPIHPVFAKEKDREECRAKHGVAAGRPMILQLAGGTGDGPVGELFEALLKVERPAELVVVTGKNAKLKAELARRTPPARHRVQVLGFTDKIDELMAAADVVVSKPGGLTTSEVLARGAAMVVANPIPGNETCNSDYLLENGAAIKVNKVPTLTYKVQTLLEDEARLARLRENARQIARPRAAYEVAEKALAMARAAVR
jgi:processive 1,2-diacylglycerol beta-glucosyltransferase